MIATRFTADQLVVSPEYATTDKATIIANATIEACKLLQHVYPDIRFAVDGRRTDNATNQVDYRGRVDVFVTVDGAWAGRIDVDGHGHWGTDKRYTFEGPFVEKGEARYYGDGRVWRKDPVKFVEAIQKQNCIRTQNPREIYYAARDLLQRNAGTRLANLEKHASRLLTLTNREALTLAFGGERSKELTDLVTAAQLHWQGIVDKVQADLDQQNEALAIQNGVELWKAHALNDCRDLDKVLVAL